MSENPGHELPRAMPITMTFYDWLRTHPYTSTFYVKEDTPDEACNKLIKAIQSLSACVLGKYKIGYRSFVVPTFDNDLKSITAYAMGTFKWRIQYSNSFGLSRAHTIPGYKREHTLGGRQPGLKKAADNPNLAHEDWKQFLEVFTNVCVSVEGEPISGHLSIKLSKSNWPPPGHKKKR